VILLILLLMLLTAVSDMSWWLVCLLVFLGMVYLGILVAGCVYLFTLRGRSFTIIKRKD
jgi:hypothetical protein